jgi:hypothetical protein
VPKVVRYWIGGVLEKDLADRVFERGVLTDATPAYPAHSNFAPSNAIGYAETTNSMHAHTACFTDGRDHVSMVDWRERHGVCC